MCICMCKQQILNQLTIVSSPSSTSSASSLWRFLERFRNFALLWRASFYACKSTNDKSPCSTQSILNHYIMQYGCRKTTSKHHSFNATRISVYFYWLSWLWNRTLHRFSDILDVPSDKLNTYNYYMWYQCSHSRLTCISKHTGTTIRWWLHK